ncbi:hypothetical protein [Methylomonas albis]|uniref:Uncharacterized protein n=1 Tax=Methylomonas albis TaxID=1854563 RepID=A0ABR9CYI1_9GAMM|nr:hypothetical protein [Methylomonas albis]MBD9355908.1 hypothetical protein [Methylomonas albis]
MPFTKPFKDVYDEGDLVYGLGKPRGRLMSEKFKLSGPNIRTVDQSTINNYATTGDEQSAYESKLQYAQGWDDKKQASARKNIENFNSALKDHGKYGTAVGWETKEKGLLRDAQENQAWRRKCKGGLYYACFVKQSHVHFCLEEMKLDEVAAKKSTNHDGDLLDIDSTNPELKMRAITSTELRWVYRNRDHGEVQRHIQFWKFNGREWEPCDPPWITDPQPWAQYKPKYKNNVHGRIEDDVRLVGFGTREPQPYSNLGVGRRESLK